jgi:hypothetical protein
MTDRRTFQTVILVLGAALILSLLSIAVLAGLDKNAPSILDNLAVGSLTGLAGLLARGPGGDEPQPVNVVNEPNDPVPVDAGYAAPGALVLIVAIALGIFLGYLLVQHVSLH